MSESLKKMGEQQQQKRGKNSTQKKRNPKKFGKSAPKGPQSVVPVNLYICECHDEQASKVPCTHAEKDKAEHKKSACPLGTWRCSITKHKCKVRRRKNSQGESVNVAQK